MRQGIQLELGNDEIATYGCYALSLLAIAQYNGTAPMSDDAVRRYINEGKLLGFIGDDCYVKNPLQFLKMVWHECPYTDWQHMAKPVNPCYCVRNVKLSKAGNKLYHFTAVLHGVEWDPLPPDRPTNVGYSVSEYRDGIR